MHYNGLVHYQHQMENICDFQCFVYLFISHVYHLEFKRVLFPVIAVCTQYHIVWRVACRPMLSPSLCKDVKSQNTKKGHICSQCNQPRCHDRAAQLVTACVMIVMEI